ncbi:SGNH hydrolase [Lophium mytilinum]|uniref:SGNH hydrolase n=1 Tax=Lophium mytilinum TaxID=390894 RepID=A0A6A6R4S9_9PEZI|nr:SGNH hydrolase [Lophium mytilinum]
MKASLLLSVGATILVPVILGTPIGGLISPAIIFPKKWASLGDSWASGVTWFKEIVYDDDHDKVIQCRRSKEAYAYQLSQNDTFLPVKDQVFNWPACSGVNFEHMEGQASEMDDGTLFATMTVGGNACGWDPLVTACVFVPDPQQTRCSPEYPDPASECYQKMVESRDALNNEENFLARYVDVLGKVMKIGKEKHGSFQLYATNYAHPFNIDPNWCDEESFGMFWCRPKLTALLRHDINDLAELLKQKIIKDVQQFRKQNHDGKSVHFVEISDCFNGHRFCENDHDITDQWDDTYTGGKTWIYLPPRPPWNDLWKDIDAWVKKYPDNNITTEGGGSAPDRPGIIMKTFHPKTLGFGTMADNIRKAVYDTLTL